MSGLLKFSSKSRLPKILQTEAAECGLACLAMVAGYHGYETDLLSLRRRFSMSLKGARLSDLMKAATQLDFIPRAVQLELDQLSQLKRPAILHWNMNHFVVLKGFRRGKVVIHDPGRGETVLGLKEVSKHFTGIALELTPTTEFKPRRERKQVRIWELWGHKTGVWSVLTQVLAFSLALEVFAIIGPLFMQITVDRVLVTGDRSLLTVLGVGFILLAVVNVAISAIRSWLLLFVNATLNFQMVNNLFRHLIRLPLDYFEKRHIGDVVSRFGSIDVIQQTLTNNFVSVIVDGMLAIGTLAMMFFYSWQLTLIALGMVIGYGLFRHILYRPLHHATEEQIVRQAKQETNLLETVRGVQSIKIFGEETNRHGVWQQLFADHVNASIRVQKLSIWFTTANGALFGLGNVAIIWLGALTILNGEFSIGMLFAFIAYEAQFTGRIQNLINQYIEYRMLALHAERVADIALTETDDASDFTSSNTMRAQCKGKVTARNLAFRYSDNDPWIFHDINFEIKAGETVAIVGPSGCGKTTLLKIMLGLLKPNSGSVEMDGMDIRQIGLATYRHWIGAVMQEDQLFAGSISDNIAFFDPQIDLERVEQCAELAAIHSDIMAMPMNYDTLIGDMGLALSGGQKQRIVLARALYRQPRILFLDEATSHLDIALEKQVNDSIKALNITRIIVAHRPETIQSAERIIDFTALESREPMVMATKP